MKRAVSTLLLIAMLASLGACGETAKTSSDDTSTPTSTDTTVSTETDIYSNLPQSDYNGMEINILGYGASYSYSDREFLYAEQTGDVVDDALYQRNMDTEQRLGIKINFKADTGDADAIKLFVSSVMAGDSEYDLLAMKSYALCNVMSNGVLMPWDDIEGINYDQPWYIQDANETYTFENNTYAIFSDALGTNMTMAWIYTFNKRLAEEWQIGDIYQVVRDGDWTMDKLMSLTKDVWKDVNGNSTPDAEDIFGYYTDKWATLDACMPTHGLTAIAKDDNDMPVLSFYSDRLVESFEKVYSLYWENSGTYVDTTSAYEYVKRFADGQGLFSPMFVQYLIETDMRAMEDEYGILPFPKLDDEQESYYTYVHPRFGGLMLPVTLTDEKAEMIGDFVEVWSAYSHKYLRPAIYDVSLSTKGTRDEESVEMLELIMENRTYDYMTAMQYGFTFPLTNDKTYRNLLAAKNKDITSYYNSNKEKAEQYIADLATALEEAAE
ncbi:MAG: hypothetical protein IJ493_08990 [Clostridia bacterium]|nr:hypothetical protein [Clostridia bacterium]